MFFTCLNTGHCKCYGRKLTVLHCLMQQRLWKWISSLSLLNAVKRQTSSTKWKEQSNAVWAQQCHWNSSCSSTKKKPVVQFLFTSWQWITNKNSRQSSIWLGMPVDFILALGAGKHLILPISNWLEMSTSSIWLSTSDTLEKRIRAYQCWNFPHSTTLNRSNHCGW